MIGFNTPGEQEMPPELTPSEEVLAELFDSIMHPPDWQEDFERTLFWALVFNTQDKVHSC